MCGYSTTCGPVMGCILPKGSWDRLQHTIKNSSELYCWFFCDWISTNIKVFIVIRSQNLIVLTIPEKLSGAEQLCIRNLLFFLLFPFFFPLSFSHIHQNPVHNAEGLEYHFTDQSYLAWILSSFASVTHRHSVPAFKRSQ